MMLFVPVLDHGCVVHRFHRVRDIGFGKDRIVSVAP